MSLKKIFLKPKAEIVSNDFWEPMPNNLKSGISPEYPVQRLIEHFSTYGHISFYRHEELMEKMVFFYNVLISSTNLNNLSNPQFNSDSHRYISNLIDKQKTGSLTYKDIIGYIGINRLEIKETAVEVLRLFEKSYETTIFCPDFYLIYEKFENEWNSKLILDDIVDLNHVKELVTTDGILEYRLHNYINAYGLLTSDNSNEISFEEIVKHLTIHDYSGKFALQRILKPIKECFPDIVDNNVYKETAKVFDFGPKRKLLENFDPNKQDKIENAFIEANLKNLIDKSLINSLERVLQILILEADKMQITDFVFDNETGKQWLLYSKEEKIEKAKFVGGFYGFNRPNLQKCFKKLCTKLEEKHPTLLDNEHYIYFKDLYVIKFISPEFNKIFMAKELFRRFIYTGKDRELLIQKNIVDIYKNLLGGNHTVSEIVDKYKRDRTEGHGQRLFNYIERSCPAYTAQIEYKEAKKEVMES